MDGDLIEAAYTDFSPGSYAGVDALYRELKKRRTPDVSRSAVKDWAKTNLAYTLHRPARRKFPRNRTTAFAVDELWQIDLCDMQELKKHNDGMNYILTVIDVFSKYGWARAIPDKRGPTVLKAFKNIVETSSRAPVKVQADAGSEFKYGKFNDYLADIDSYYYITHSEMKSAVVERWNRTLKTRMWRYFTHANTYRWVDVLQKLVDSYNGSPHRTLRGRTPASIGSHNQLKVWKEVYAPPPRKEPRFKFDVGDAVRISRDKTVFEKGYTANFSEEHFEISERLARRPPVYRIKDLSGEVLAGVFYEAELQPVTIASDGEYRIEKVLKRLKGKSLVKWRGWPEKFSSWEPTRNLRKL